MKDSISQTDPHHNLFEVECISWHQCGDPFSKDPLKYWIGTFSPFTVLANPCLLTWLPVLLYSAIDPFNNLSCNNRLSVVFVSLFVDCWQQCLKAALDIHHSRTPSQRHTLIYYLNYNGYEYSFDHWLIATNTCGSTLHNNNLAKNSTLWRGSKDACCNLVGRHFTWGDSFSDGLNLICGAQSLCMIFVTVWRLHVMLYHCT